MRAIDADALIDWLKKAGRYVKGLENHKPLTGIIGKLIDHIENMRTIDPESLRPQSEWEAYPSDQYRRCSHCKTEWEKEKIPRIANYCPYCGARMKGE